MKDKLYKCNSGVLQLAKATMDLVLKKNKGFKTFKKNFSIINCEYETKDVNITLTQGQIESFKYAPITPCDLERNFS